MTQSKVHTALFSHRSTQQINQIKQGDENEKEQQR